MSHFDATRYDSGQSAIIRFIYTYQNHVSVISSRSCKCMFSIPRVWSCFWRVKMVKQHLHVACGCLGYGWVRLYHPWEWSYGSGNASNRILVSKNHELEYDHACDEGKLAYRFFGRLAHACDKGGCARITHVRLKLPYFWNAQCVAQ